MTEKENQEKMKVDQQGRLKQEFTKLVEAMFETFDTDGGGTLSNEELELGLRFTDTDETRELMAHAGMDQTILDAALEVCDQEGKEDGITKRDFVIGMNSLMDAPRASDVHKVYKRLAKTEKRLTANMELLAENQKAIIETQNSILAHLKIDEPRKTPIGVRPYDPQESRRKSGLVI